VLDHVTIRVSNREASRAFYGLALAEPTHDGDIFVDWGDFSLLQDANVTRRLHLGFGVPSRDAVDAWWRRLVDAGYESDGEPGPRPRYSASYYGAFVLDPDGNSAEAVHKDPTRGSGVDHLWFRSRDLEAARRFYQAVARPAGLQLRHASPDRVTFGWGGGSFTFVPGEPTENVHVAFGASDRETVDAFHAAALAAGYRSNGAPGERPHYHPGYYGAFVLDPDGHNVEAVFHDR
jgi:catechol 2,3-dioxygenase-like lactoylglutathione lyase family enzyme